MGVLCAHNGRSAAARVIGALSLFLAIGFPFLADPAAGNPPQANQPATEAPGPDIAALRAEVDEALSAGLTAERYEPLAERVQKAITGTADVNQRLSAIKLAARLCWEGPPDRSPPLREFALTELMQLAPQSPRARVMLVDQFLPPLHRVGDGERRAMLAQNDELLERLMARCECATTRCDLRFLQCRARVEALRAWPCPWLKKEERDRLDDWLAELEASTEAAPAGGNYGEVIPPIRSEIRQTFFGADLSSLGAPNLEGATVSLGSYRGKVVIMSFWSSWCLPCLELVKDEAAMIERLGAGFVLVGVNSDATTEQARRTVAAHGMTWPQLWSPPESGDGLVERLFIRQWPSVVVLDRVGTVRAKFVGSAYQGKLTMAEVERAAREIAAEK